MLGVVNSVKEHADNGRLHGNIKDYKYISIESRMGYNNKT